MHKEYLRINPEADTAILLMHGIVGTPRHFDMFLDLIPEEFSVYNLLLDGHGGMPADFSHTSMSKWQTQVRGVVEMLLRDHKNVYIVAHSMGTLLSINESVRNDGIKGMFFLASPLKLFIKPRLVSICWKVYKENIKPQDHIALAAKSCYGILPDKNLLHYVGWIPRFLDLFALIKQTVPNVNAVDIPCFAYQSELDELVSLKSVDILSANPNIVVRILKGSSHYFYPQEDMEYLRSEFVSFIKSAADNSSLR